MYLTIYTLKILYKITNLNLLQTKKKLMYFVNKSKKYKINYKNQKISNKTVFVFEYYNCKKINYFFYKY